MNRMVDGLLSLFGSSNGLRKYIRECYIRDDLIERCAHLWYCSRSINAQGSDAFRNLDFLPSLSK